MCSFFTHACIYHRPASQPVLARVMAMNASAMTPIIPGLTKDVTAQQSPPSSVVFAPAWTHPESSYGVQLPSGANGTAASASSAAGPRAICANGFHWTTVLSDTIPRSITSALVVLHGPDDSAYTFMWDGTAAADAGEGDRAEQLLPRSFARRPLSFGANATGGAWRVTLYATPALAAQYVTSRPRDTALAVIAASLGCVLLFGCV
jgi:hypothetical protein